MHYTKLYTTLHPAPLHFTTPHHTKHHTFQSPSFEESYQAYYYLSNKRNAFRAIVLAVVFFTLFSFNDLYKGIYTHTHTHTHKLACLYVDVCEYMLRCYMCMCLAYVRVCVKYTCTSVYAPALRASALPKHLHYTTLHHTLHRTTHYTTLHYTAPHYSTLHQTTPHATHTHRLPRPAQEHMAHSSSGWCGHCTRLRSHPRFLSLQKQATGCVCVCMFISA
jgi:hypothetical protein